jgi:hypothetical protein
MLMDADQRGSGMFSLIKALGVEMSLRREAGPFIVAFLIASFFFKFGSFALECLAFLGVWYVLSLLQSLIFSGRHRSDKG